MCEQQYFIEYVLGWRGPSNKKADKGTIVHKALEILAMIKHASQNQKTYIDDEIIGSLDINNYDLDDIIKKVYNYYTSNFNHHAWEEKDFKDCYNWTYKAINYGNGMFDPRNREIICPEKKFDIVIDKPWSKYAYEINGENISGNLGIKGTIDLITKVNDSTIEIVDWKTGRRLDWATGQEKTAKKLQNDPQLMIYYYAAQQLYPDIEHIIITIFFINDGGPFSIMFDKSYIKATEEILRKKYEYIKKTQKPKLKNSWICSKLCHFGKTTFENTEIYPITEYRDNQVSKNGEYMTKCQQIGHDIEMKGMKEVIDEYQVPGYNIAHYKAPGSTE